MNSLGDGCFSVGEKVAIAFKISEADQRQFAQVSGDLNPVHLDRDYAARMGFVGLVVYGGLLVAKLSQVIGLHLPGPVGLWSNLQIDFRQPLLVGEAAELTAEITQISEASRSMVVGFTIASASGVVAKGKALTTLMKPIAA